jgi:predicted RNase H-like HicB family nuclease
MELHARIHEEDDGTFWAEVKELPGCFASGHTLDELREALGEAIAMCLPADEATGKPVKPIGRPRIDELTLVTA